MSLKWDSSAIELLIFNMAPKRLGLSVYKAHWVPDENRNHSLMSIVSNEHFPMHSMIDQSLVASYEQNHLCLERNEEETSIKVKGWALKLSNCNCIASTYHERTIAIASFNIAHRFCAEQRRGRVCAIQVCFTY